MAEKATLIQQLPPVAKKSSSGDSTRVDAKAEASAATELQPETEVSISSFQAVTYGTFVLSFVLAGFAAVVLYRKAINHTGQGFIKSTKLLAATLALMGIHGFVATYGYTNYLREVSDNAPVSLTFLIWIIFGATVGYISNRLIAKNARLKTSDAVVDALLYVTVFILATLAVSDQIGPNASLILALVALITCTAPLSRFFISCKRLKFNQQSRDQRPRKPLLYSLVLLPTLLPLFALIYVAEGIGPDPMLFSINMTASALILLAAINMLAALKRSLSEPASETETTAAASAPAPAAPTMDPLVAELLAEQAAADAEAESGIPAEPAPNIQSVEDLAPKKPPPPTAPKRAPNRPTSPTNKGNNPLEAPKKPEKAQKDSEKSAPNSPKKIMAPSKPKKRF